MRSKIILFDTQSDITLMEESTSCLSLPVNLMCYSSFPAALQAIQEEQPDLIMIGSRMLFGAGFEMFPLKENIPIVILSEGDGFNILTKEYNRDILFLTRPFDLDGIPGMFEAAYQFLKLCKEKEHVFPQIKR